MNLKEKMQELDDRVNKLDNLGLLTNGSFYVKATLQSLFIRVNAKDELGTLSVPFWLLSALSNLEKRIEALENACEHKNYTFDWVYTYIGDKQHEKIRRCSNCKKTYEEPITESCADAPKYIPVDGSYHNIKYMCTYCNEVFRETWAYCVYGNGSVCTDCGFERHSHAYTDEITTPPSCGTKGIKTWTCSCGDSYTEDIPALSHNFKETVGPTCQSMGSGIWICEHCGRPGTDPPSPINPDAHSWSYDPCRDCNEFYCTRCGYGHINECPSK